MSHFNHVGKRAVMMLNSIYNEPWHFTSESILVKPRVFLPVGLFKEPPKNPPLPIARELSIPEKFQQKGFSSNQVQFILKSMSTREHSEPEKLFLVIDNFDVMNLLASRCGEASSV